VNSVNQEQKPFESWTTKLAMDVAIIHILINHLLMIASCPFIYITMKIY
jgi:hypothetical protein